MKQYKFTQNVPQGLGIIPKTYDFDTIHELIESDLFQKFQGAHFSVIKEQIHISRNGKKSLFGTIASNEIEFVIESTPDFSGFGTQNRNIKHSDNNPLGVPASRELDMISQIMKKPHIKIDSSALEEQANRLGDHGLEDERTPEQRLGLI